MRLKSTFPVTIQSPFSNHSVTIQSTEMSDLTVSFSSSISFIEKKNPKTPENILIPNIYMFWDIQCHAYFVKHTAFVILRVRPQWIMTDFYKHIFHFSSVSLLKERMVPSATRKKENHLMFVYLFNVYSMIYKYVNSSLFIIDKSYIS